MKVRTDIMATDPVALKAMLSLENYVNSTPLTATHKDLIKIRASQINGCAYCINMHTVDARKRGETEQRIYLLNAWQEATLYTDEERAILALTEEMTLIQQQVSNETYDQAVSLFDQGYLTAIMMAIVTINSWNRLAIASKKRFD